MINQPVQARSQRTLDAIVAAAEALLEERSFAEIGIAEIVLKAGVSNGSFYARFASKNDLLPALYARYDAGLGERMDALEEGIARESSLAGACRALVDWMVAFFADRKNLMRAVALFARDPAEPVAALSEGRGALHRRMVALFRPFHPMIGGADPDRRVCAALFVATAAVRESVLFPHAPFARVTALPPETLHREVAEMMCAHLLCRKSGS